MPSAVHYPPRYSSESPRLYKQGVFAALDESRRYGHQPLARAVNGGFMPRLAERIAGFKAKSGEVSPLGPLGLQGVSVKPLLQAAGLLSLAFLLRRLPAQASAGVRSLVSSDWKVWAKVILGVVAVDRLNKFGKAVFDKDKDWKLPPWFGALETVAVLHPLMVGFSKRYPLEVGIMAPLVAGMVTAANWVSGKLASPLKDSLRIPDWLTRLGISLGFALPGIVLFPKAINGIARLGLLGKAARETAAQGKNVVLGSVAIGANCGCGNVICITQMGELFGGMGNWLQSHFGLNRQ